ncbi:MAG: MlaD family protein [Fibromonadales bacterium]|nr:MlaD family protein [Fibromonadales bacterium]
MRVENRTDYWWRYPIILFRIWAKRRRIKKLSKSPPWAFYSIIASIILLPVSLWFFLHPNSPWHARNYYYIDFNEIGNLKINDAVNVNGLTRGSVKEFVLTDSCVWAKIAVLSKIKIPVNSKLHVANIGLMGDRVIEITLGNSNAYYQNGAHFTGSFDMGSTSMGILVVGVLEEAKAIADILGNTLDTLFSEERIKDYKILKHKANTLGNKTSRMVSSAERSAVASIDSLVDAKDKIIEIIDNMKPHFDGISDNLDLLQANFITLKSSLKKIENSITLIADLLESGDNTISLALDKRQDGDLRREMLKISKDAEQLMKKITKDGLDLNVTIFN